MKKGVKRGLGIAALSMLAGAAWSMSTSSGARMLSSFASSYLQYSKLGDLKLNLQDSLLRGLASHNGAYQAPDEGPRFSWDKLHLDWPIYENGAWIFPSIEIQGLSIQLASSDTAPPDSADWLSQTSQALASPPSTPHLDLQSLHIQRATILDANGSSLLRMSDLQAGLELRNRHWELNATANQLNLDETKINTIKTQALWNKDHFEIRELELDAPLGHARIDKLYMTPSTEGFGFTAFDLTASQDDVEDAMTLHLRAPQGQLQGRLDYHKGTNLVAQSSLQGQIENLRSITLDLAPSCAPCGPLPLHWKGRVNLKADAVKQAIQARATFSAPNQQLEANFDLQALQTLATEVSWNSRSLHPFHPALAGQSQGQANCKIQPRQRAIQCRTKLVLRDLYPNTKAQGELDLDWSLDKGLAASISSLDLEAFKQRVHSASPDARVHLRSDGSFQVQGLTLQSPDRRSLLAFDAHSRPSKGLQVHARAKHWELALLSAFIPNLDLRGILDLKLDLEPNQAAISAKLKRLHWKRRNWGQLSVSAKQGARRIRLRGRLFGSSHARISLTGTIPAALGQKLEIKQLFSPRAKAQLSIHHLDSAALATLSGLPTIRGALDGEIIYTGAKHSPKLAAQIDWVNPGWRSLHLKRIALQANLDQKQLTASLTGKDNQRGQFHANAALEVKSGRRPGLPTLDLSGPISASMRIQRWPIAPVASDFGLAKLGGTLDANVSLRGLATNPQLRGWTSVWNPRFRDLRGKELTVSVSHRDHETRIELAAYRGQGRAQAQAIIPLHMNLQEPLLRWEQHRPHAIDLWVHHFDTSVLAGLVPIPPGFEATAELHAKGNRSKYQTSAKLEVVSNKPRLRPFKLIAHAALAPATQSLRLRLTKQGESRLLAKLSTRAVLDKILRDPSTWRTIPVQLSLRSDELRLQEIAPWLPSQLDRPRGTLTVNAKGSGPLGAPLLRGSAKIRDGELTVLALRQRWTDLNANIELSGHKITLASLSAQAGPGKIIAKGRGILRAPYSGSLAMELQRVPVSLAGAPDMEASAHLLAKAKLQPDEIKIDARLSKARIEVFERYNAAVKDVPSNPNIHFANPTPKASENQGPPLDLPPLHLSAEIADRLRIEGQTISTAWTGNLHIVHDAKNTRAQGTLRASPRGSFDLLNNHFVLDRAKFDFSQSQGLMPFVDLRAQTQVENEDITVTAQGPADDPNLTFESSTGSTKSEILAALVTGSSNQSPDGENKLLAKAASALIAEHTRGLGQMAKRIGVDNLRVSFGDSLSDTIVSAGTWIRPRIYLESRVRAQAPEGESRVQGRIRFNFKKNWVLEGYVGDRSSGGGGVWWHRPQKSGESTTPSKTEPNKASQR